MKLAHAAKSLGIALLLGAAAGFHASARALGDEVVITTKSGKQYTAVLVSRSDDEVVIRLGDNEVTLPMIMVESIEAVEADVPPEPVVASQAAKGAEGDAEDGEREGGPPRPSTVLLKDGTVIEGYIVAKDSSRMWLIQAPPKTVRLDDVEEIYGESEPLTAGGASSGDAGKDVLRLLNDVAEGNTSKAKIARGSIQAMGEDAIPGLLKGLDAKEGQVRLFCMTTLGGLHGDEILEPVLKSIRTDPDPLVRATCAEILTRFAFPIVRRTLLEVTWREKDDGVKAAAARALARTATPEEASALIDLLHIVSDESAAWKPIFEALRRATGRNFAADSNLWEEWWEAEGREEMANRIEEINQEKIRESERRYKQQMGAGTEEEEAVPEETPPK